VGAVALGAESGPGVEACQDQRRRAWCGRHDHGGACEGQATARSEEFLSERTVVRAADRNARCPCYIPRRYGDARFGRAGIRAIPIARRAAPTSTSNVTRTAIRARSAAGLPGDSGALPAVDRFGISRVIRGLDSSAGPGTSTSLFLAAVPAGPRIKAGGPGSLVGDVRDLRIRGRPIPDE